MQLKLYSENIKIIQIAKHDDTKTLCYIDNES